MKQKKKIQKKITHRPPSGSGFDMRQESYFFSSASVELLDKGDYENWGCKKNTETRRYTVRRIEKCEKMHK